MITVVARWEDQQMPPELEHRMWRQLKGAFTTEPAEMRLIFTPKLHESHGVEQYDTMDEALAAAGDGDRVFLEHTGYKSMGDIPQGDIVLILGNTKYSNMEYANVDETYRIHTPSAAVLYGHDAAAIALAIRYGQ